MHSNGLLAIGLENEMWAAVVARDVPKFQKLVSKDAVMICGGLKCSGREYAAFIPDFNMSGCEIINMAATYADENCAHLHYIVRVSVTGEENDLSGAFYVTSFWRREDELWQLIFNMDSRVEEPGTSPS